MKDCPFKLDEWVKTATEYASRPEPEATDPARGTGFRDRPSPPSGAKSSQQTWNLLQPFCGRPKTDGGWGKGEKASDIESTYRVMRALML